MQKSKFFQKKKKKLKKHHFRNCICLLTFNNTIISISDENGNVVSWSSAGSKGFKGSRKSTLTQRKWQTDDADAKAFEAGIEDFDSSSKGPGSGRETALRSLQSRGFKILSIKDTTPMPHNGARPPKKESLMQTTSNIIDKNWKFLIYLV